VCPVPSFVFWRVGSLLADSCRYRTKNMVPGYLGLGRFLLKFSFFLCALFPVPSFVFFAVQDRYLPIRVGTSLFGVVDRNLQTREQRRKSWFRLYVIT
jgi:hypothetical protein